MMGGRGEGIFSGAVTCWIVLASLLLIRGFQTALVAADLPSWSLLLGFAAAFVVARSVVRNAESVPSDTDGRSRQLSRLQHFGLAIASAVVGGFALATVIAIAGLPAAGIAVGLSTVAMTALLTLVGKYIRLDRPVAAGKALTLVAGLAWLIEGLRPGLFGSLPALGIATVCLSVTAAAFVAFDGAPKRVSLVKRPFRLHLTSRFVGRALSATISVVTYVLLSLLSFSVAQAAGWYGTLPATLVQGVDPTTVQPAFLAAAFGSVLTQIGLEITIRRYLRSVRTPIAPAAPRRSLVLATGRRLGTIMTSVLRVN